MRIAAMLPLLICFVLPLRAQEAVDPVALNNEGVKLLESGKLDDAIERFRKSIAATRLQQKPEDPVVKANLVQAYLTRAVKHIDATEWDAAIHALDDARALDPKLPIIQVYFGVVNLRQGYYDRAFAFLSEALLLDEKSATAWQYMGFVHYRQESLERALESWRKAIELQPNLAKGLAEHVEKAERELAVESQMAIERSSHFVCKYNTDIGRDVVDLVLSWLEDAYGDIGSSFHFYPGGELTVVLYSDREFSSATSVHSWAAGLFDGKVRIPVKNFTARRSALRDTIHHEYTHYVISNLTRQCPAWLNEGLAQIFEGKKAKDVKRVVADANARGELVSLSSRGATFTNIRDARQAGLAYAQALSFTAYLLDRYTLSDVESLLRDLKPKVNFDSAFENVFRRSLEELEKDWRETL